MNVSVISTEMLAGDHGDACQLEVEMYLALPDIGHS